MFGYCLRPNHVHLVTAPGSGELGPLLVVDVCLAKNTAERAYGDLRLLGDDGGVNGLARHSGELDMAALLTDRRETCGF